MGLVSGGGPAPRGADAACAARWASRRGVLPPGAAAWASWSGERGGCHAGLPSSACLWPCRRRGTKPGDWAELELDTTQRGGDDGGGSKDTFVWLSYLRSYAGMGVASVECVGGCRCEGSRLDGTWERRASLFYAARFHVRRGRAYNWLGSACMVPVMVGCVGSPRCLHVPGVVSPVRPRPWLFPPAFRPPPSPAFLPPLLPAPGL